MIGGMIGHWAEHAERFLVALGLVSILTLGLPMLVAPLAWARALRWRVPAADADRHLAIYFGRCLGAVVCVLAGFAFVAAATPALQPFYLQLSMASFALMIGVHAWGALRRIQPWTETAEILLWAALLLLAALVYPAARP